MAKILFFGDSITQGFWDEEGGWVDRIKRDVHAESVASDFVYYHEIYNLGISGENTSSLLVHFEQELLPRIADEEIIEIIIIFAIGVNDSQVYQETQETRVPFDQFKKNLQSLFTISKKYKAKVIFVGLTPADESRVDPIPWTPEKSYTNASIKKFNGTIKDFCQTNKVLFIDIFDEWSTSGYQHLLIDGIHPTTVGHEKLYKRIKSVLERENII